MGMLREVKTMRIAMILSVLLLISGCGLDSLGAAATTAKLQADQAKQAKENMDTFKSKLDEANKATEESARRAEEAGQN
jgi:hypothetical protein